MGDMGISERYLMNLWEHLDSACGSLEHAQELVEECEFIPSYIKQGMSQIDFSLVTELKNRVEDELLKLTGNEAMIDDLRENGECKDE
ncbi:MULTISPECIES: hypothetical protein [unclassified Exiguobacterium]|uniref:hypothetical protein n=1 Tax=unclassified Exiguobacterium TaxID=2644629 RepID=UPI001BE7E961|nr:MULTISPECIES: hypothetical protein [unclassified Exiguobacterium]